MLSPTVSVIIPTYNAQSTIIRVIESVLNQKFSNLEILIVDDKSTDKTVKTVKKRFPNLSIIELPENLGVANARNEGIRLSRGKYIAFLDSDDLWNEEKLLYQITFMERKNCDASCTYVEYGTFQDQGFVGSYIKEPEFVYSLDNYKDLLIDNETFPPFGELLIHFCRGAAIGCRLSHNLFFLFVTDRLWGVFEVEIQ